jgi:hypothetical protein
MDSSEIEKRRRAYEHEDRVYDLQPSEAEKRELLHELQDGVWKFVKERAWWISVLVAIGVPVLIYTVVERIVDQRAATPLKAVEKNLTQAELLAERAKKAASDATGAADQATSQVSSLTKGLEDLQQKAAGVEKQFGLVTERINAEGKNAALRSSQDFKAVQERIASLEALVKKIGDENDATRKATAEYAKKVSVLESQIERNQKRFAENSQYTVLISFVPEQKAIAQEVQNVLANIGFKASTTESSTERKSNYLLYLARDETKAQEILELIKPILKDVRSAKIPTTKLESEVQTKTGQFKLPDVLFGPRGGWVSAISPSFFLQLGS